MDRVIPLAAHLPDTGLTGMHRLVMIGLPQALKTLQYQHLIW
jgi:hypothetical protein